MSLGHGWRKELPEFLAGLRELHPVDRHRTGSSSGVQEEGPMVKLYKRDTDATRYWEAWDHEGHVIIHWGRVGEEGETRVVYPERGDSAEAVIDRESQQPRAEGFQEIDTEDLTTLIVQYKTKTWGSPEDLEKRHEVEDLLGECLDWTGNGRGVGGDIGSGTINIFLSVVDPYLAKDTILETLEQEELLEGAVIAIERDDDFVVLWPEDFQGEFSY